ncbi:MAG TPA: serine/threonine-protein kinase [Gemmatimonadales bacterium]|nr:serine/threonine-protein kinase [Gemmatimonadales bacterium]
MTLRPAALLGRTLGPYRLDRLLGEGGFAWVFAAREPDGTPVAVKVLKPRYADDPQVAARFHHESETAARLDHPNIIRIHRVARDGGYAFFAMELCADSLRARLARTGPLPEPELVGIARDLTAALGFAHARGVIHRDLKPDNVLLRADGTAVLTDFGIARALSGSVASTGVNLTIGTPQYLSPEQAQGRPFDARADLYALGVTLYQAATGEVPFRSHDWFELARLHVEAPPSPPRQRRPELSKRFERVVLKCLAKHPDDRYPDATALRRDLDEIAQAHRATAAAGRSPPGAGEIVARRRRRSWPLLVALLLGALGLIAAVVTVMR